MRYEECRKVLRDEMERVKCGIFIEIGFVRYRVFFAAKIL